MIITSYLSVYHPACLALILHHSRIHRRLLVNRGWVPRDLRESGEVMEHIIEHPLVCGVVKVSDQVVARTLAAHI